MENHVNQMIRTHGFAFVTIADGAPPFAYSVGMSKTYGLPEFVVVGTFGPETMNALAGCVHSLVTANPNALRGPGPTIADALACTDPRNPLGVPVKYAIGWKVVPRHRVAGPAATIPMTLATKRYGEAGFEVRQLFAPDANGKLPWDGDCSPAWKRDSGQVDFGA